MGYLTFGIAAVVMLWFGYYFSVSIFNTLVAVYRWIAHRKYLWNQPIAHPTPLQFASTSMAVRPTVLGHEVPLGYRLSCLYFSCGLIDRTQTLQQGFPYTVIDPIPHYNHLAKPKSVNTRPEANKEMSDLCADRAQQILKRARAENRFICVLWSGGIDSTAAACSLIQHSDPLLDRIEFCYGKNSIKEYKAFFRNVVKLYPHQKIKTVRQSLNRRAIVVTGEHGDQLFGSIKAFNLPWADLNAPWIEAFPKHLKSVLASEHRVKTVVEYLSPQIEKSPVPLVTLLDLLWWINFSLKWQSVSLRVPLSIAKSNNGDRVREQLHSTEHFYRDSAFEVWALKNRQWAVTPGNWKSYKMPLKQVIHDFNGDSEYLNFKGKVPSLQYVSSRKGIHRALGWDGKSSILYQRFDSSLRKPIPGKEHKKSFISQRSKNRYIEGSGAEASPHNGSAEGALWSGLDNDGG